MTEKLTEKEREVLYHLQQGKPNKLIGAELNMEETAIKAHLRNLMRRFCKLCDSRSRARKVGLKHFKGVVMSLRRLMCFLVATIWSLSASAATIEQAWDIHGHYRWAIKVEGDIVPGETSKLLGKLLDFYMVFGPKVDTVYLMSKGGDVEEAMQMGTLIRRLRLKLVS